MFDPVALAKRAVHDVGFVPEAVGVPVELDGKLAVKSMFWPPVLKPPPLTACCPAGQVAVTWTLFALLETTVTVAVPATPVGPLAPVVPCGPVGPLAPVGPRAPVGPVAPFAPVAPLGPVGPVGPRVPVVP